MDVLNQLKEKSRKRRNLISQQMGLTSPEDLSKLLGNPQRKKDHPKASDAEMSGNFSQRHMRQQQFVSSKDFHVSLEEMSEADVTQTSQPEEDQNEPQIETYKGSSTFLKGTQSANPHNDYCQHFVDTGQRPQNFIRDVGLADRFEEYPKLKELIRLKDDLISRTACAPAYLKSDLRKFPLDLIKGKFDVILVEPMLEEYQRHPHPATSRAPKRSFWTWPEIMGLPIEEIAAQRSFVFLWCGSSDGLDWGRKCLRKWGFRRCEDICWIQTNIRSPGNKSNLDAILSESKSLFQRTKEHCLMGIKGTVRRSTDGDFIHANVDIDLIITEEPEYGSQEKPEEIFHMIEHFCLGRRRLHLFGRDTTIRNGWLTMGPDLTNTNFNPDVYWSFFDGPNGHLTGCTDRIESLRPKSPPPKSSKNPGHHSSSSSVTRKF